MAHQITETIIDVPNARCINRVPVRIRSGKEDECTPRVVSIGPLHHGKESLKVMEGNKMIYVQDFLQRTNSSWESCFDLVKKHEDKLRSCYDDGIDNLNSDEYVNIILVDAVFIIEVLLRWAFLQDRYPAPPASDRIFSRPWMRVDVVSDMMLLENQVPFFILGTLFDPHKSLLLPHDRQPDSLITLAYQLFEGLMVFREKREAKLEKIRSMEVEHFVHFLLCFYIPLDQDAPQGAGVPDSIDIYTPSLTELHQAGVKFEMGSNIHALDTQFTAEQGILKLPAFIVDRQTARIIRNMLAFEQCHLTRKSLSVYIVFMNNLVISSKDVDLLIDYGIVALFPSDSSDMISVLSSLSKGILLNRASLDFSPIWESLRGHVKKPWNKRKANLKQNYFNTPWATISVIAAAFLIILTLLQTVFSVISPNYQ